MPELAEVFRVHGGNYLEQFGRRLLPSHRRALRDIAACRTERLGGQLTECRRCGHRHPVYHSCRHRCCPKCHATDTARWLAKRQAELLPVPYAHAIFTLLEALRESVRRHQKTLYGVLMKAAAEALMELTADRHYVGGQIGLLAVLHTWGGAMVFHPHVHCLIPAGGLTEEGEWLSARKRYLVPVQALSRIFRAKFMALARKAHPELAFPQSLWDKDWVVYCKPAPQGGQKVLNYLGRYVHRVAITNRRITKIDQGRIGFGYKDSRTRKWRTTSLPAPEFIRRFLQHVLPKGFNKVRYYGLLSPTNRSTLKRVQLLLTPPAVAAEKAEQVASPETNRTQEAARPCPLCGLGWMIVIGRLPRQCRAPPDGRRQ
jgi:hypothetical protein